MVCFNPRICKRCDIHDTGACRLFVVSIHASVKDATPCWICLRMAKYVSIHASVKDATVACVLFFVSIFVSIHASVKDATCYFPIHSSPDSSFNPRICKRCDDFDAVEFSRWSVSIHASVKDATPPLGVLHPFHLVSIHASVKDATKCAPTLRGVILFQSTHL